MEQWYSFDTAPSAYTCDDAPHAIGPVSTDPSSRTTRCATTSAFMKSTVCPTAQVAGFGEKDNAPFTPVIVIVTTLAVPVGGVRRRRGGRRRTAVPHHPLHDSRTKAARARTYTVARVDDIEASETEGDAATSVPEPRSKNRVNPGRSTRGLSGLEICFGERGHRTGTTLSSTGPTARSHACPHVAERLHACGQVPDREGARAAPPPRAPPTYRGRTPARPPWPHGIRRRERRAVAVPPVSTRIRPPRSTLLNSWVRWSGSRFTSTAPATCAKCATTPPLSFRSSGTTMW